MTRTQAWRKVAEAFGTPYEQRTPSQQGLARLGFCSALSLVHEMSPHDTAIIYRLLTPVARDVFQDNWPDYQCVEGDAFRATFAGLMAAMTQRERNQLVEGL